MELWMVYQHLYEICKESMDNRPMLGNVLVHEQGLIASDGFRVYLYHTHPKWEDWRNIHEISFIRKKKQPDGEILTVDGTSNLWPCGDLHAAEGKYPDVSFFFQLHEVDSGTLTMGEVREALTVKADKIPIPFGAWQDRPLGLSRDYVEHALRYTDQDYVTFSLMSNPKNAEITGPVRIVVTSGGYVLTAFIMPRGDYWREK